MEDYHARFVQIYNQHITRPGADRLLNWLETTDFFTAPASTRFHGACECGLVKARREGKWQHYSVDADRLREFTLFMETLMPRGTNGGCCR